MPGRIDSCSYTFEVQFTFEENMCILSLRPNVFNFWFELLEQQWFLTSECFERFFPAEFRNFLFLRHVQSINQREICRAPLYDTSMSANSSQWYSVRTIKKYTVESFSKCTDVSNVVKVERVFQAAGPE